MKNQKHDTTTTVSKSNNQIV